MCTFHQSSPESFFRKGLIVSRLRRPEEGGGTITLTDSKLIVYTVDTDERTVGSHRQSNFLFVEKVSGICSSDERNEPLIACDLEMLVRLKGLFTISTNTQ